MADTIGTGYAAAANYDSIQNPSVSNRGKADGSFSDTMAEKFSLSPRDMTLTEYKLYFHDRVRELYTHPSQRNVDWFIDITDDAYRRMQSDPWYEQQVLDYLARNKAANVYGHAPRFVYLHIDDTLEKSYGYAFGLQEDSRAKRAAERRRMAAEQAKKARRKKLLKEYLKKRAEAKRLHDQFLKNQRTMRWLEHVRLTRQWQKEKQTVQQQREKTDTKKQELGNIVKEWNEERQAVQAYNAYEASIIMMSRCEDQLFS